MADRSPTLSQRESAGTAEADVGPQAGAEIFCKLCLSEQPSAATTELQSCKCIYCTNCLQQYVQLAVTEGGGAPITCPDMACQMTGVLLDSEIAHLVSADQMELYQRLKFERGVQLDPSKAWCPVIECQAMCDVQPTVEGRPAAVPCPTCHAVFCSGCRGPWQDGHTCPEHQPIIFPSPAHESRISMLAQDAEGPMWIPSSSLYPSWSPSDSDADMPIKQCPLCGIYIERNQGCAQMLCKNCRHTFCWYCLQSLDTDIFLRHYDRGPCRNKLGHSRASVMWNRTQVVGILMGLSIIMVVASPLFLLAMPCFLCCVCKPCRGKKKKKKRRNNLSQTDHTAS